MLGRLLPRSRSPWDAALIRSQKNEQCISLKSLPLLPIIVFTDVFAKIISVVAEIGHDPSFFPGCLENKQMADILLRAVARQRLEIYGV